MRPTIKTIFWVFFVLFIIAVPRLEVHADGFEVNDAPVVSKPRALPPPLVEDLEPLFISPEAEEEMSEEDPPPPAQNFWPLISKGMVLKAPSPEGRITASEDQKFLLGQGDLVYLESIGEAFLPDQEWVVYRLVKEVFHPKTKNTMGDLVQILGVVSVIDIDETVATARITRSQEPIERGDPIAHMNRFVPLNSVLGAAPEDGKEGYIVEMRDQRVNLAQHDIVYIDQGKSMGVVPGDEFVIIHQGKRSALALKSKLPQTRALPYRRVASMVVLSTQAESATARIVHSIEPVATGDTILFQGR